MAYIDDFLADKTRRKVVVTGIIAGGAALAAGFGRAIDKKFPGYKRSSDTSYLFMRGALIGGLLSLPAAAYAANMGVNINAFGRYDSIVGIRKLTKRNDNRNIR